MSADIMQCGCEVYGDNGDCCKYPALLEEAKSLRARVAELERALADQGRAHTESRAADVEAMARECDARVAELERDLATEQERSEGWRDRAGAATQRVAELERENAALRGITPELPPRSLHGEGDGMPRYGLRFNGPTKPFSVPMVDGYWTPWHLAESRAYAAEQRAKRMTAEVLAACEMIENARYAHGLVALRAALAASEGTTGGEESEPAMATALAALLDAAERQAAGFPLPAEEWFAVRDYARAALPKRDGKAVSHD